MPKKQINLLPREEFEKKPLGRFLTWALSVGRYIVVITELIVLIAFFSRFKLDRDLSDLYDQIQQKQAQITAQAAFEEEFRTFQAKLNTIKTLEQNQTQAEEIIATISQAIPNDTILSQLTFSEEGIQITGKSLSELGLGGLINNLSASEKFENLNITNLSKKADEGISFTITFKLKKERGNATKT